MSILFGRKRRVGISLSTKYYSDVDALTKDIARAYRDIVAVAPPAEEWSSSFKEWVSKLCMPPALNRIEQEYLGIISTFNLWMTWHLEHECGLFLLLAHPAVIHVDLTSLARLNTRHLCRAPAHARSSACIRVVFRRKMCELQTYENENAVKVHFSDIDMDVGAHKQAVQKNIRPDHDHIDLLRGHPMRKCRMVITESEIDKS